MLDVLYKQRLQRRENLRKSLGLRNSLLYPAELRAHKRLLALETKRANTIFSALQGWEKP